MPKHFQQLGKKPVKEVQSKNNELVRRLNSAILIENQRAFSDKKTTDGFKLFSTNIVHERNQKGHGEQVDADEIQIEVSSDGT